MIPLWNIAIWRGRQNGRFGFSKTEKETRLQFENKNKFPWRLVFFSRALHASRKILDAFSVSDVPIESYKKRRRESWERILIRHEVYYWERLSNFFFFFLSFPKNDSNSIRENLGDKIENVEKQCASRLRDKFKSVSAEPLSHHWIHRYVHRKLKTSKCHYNLQTVDRERKLSLSLNGERRRTPRIIIYGSDRRFCSFWVPVSAARALEIWPFFPSPNDLLATVYSPFRPRDKRRPRRPKIIPDEEKPPRRIVRSDFI